MDLSALVPITQVLCADLWMFYMQLNITPGQKGLVQLIGDVPSWINFQDREKVKASIAVHLLHK